MNIENIQKLTKLDNWSDIEKTINTLLDNKETSAKKLDKKALSELNKQNLVDIEGDIVDIDSCTVNIEEYIALQYKAYKVAVWAKENEIEYVSMDKDSDYVWYSISYEDQKTVPYKSLEEQKKYFTDLKEFMDYFEEKYDWNTDVMLEIPIDREYETHLGVITIKEFDENTVSDLEKYFQNEYVDEAVEVGVFSEINKTGSYYVYCGAHDDRPTYTWIFPIEDLIKSHKEELEKLKALI